MNINVHVGVCFDVYMNVCVIDTGYIDELIVQQLLDVQIWLYTQGGCVHLWVREHVCMRYLICAAQTDR